MATYDTWGGSWGSSWAAFWTVTEAEEDERAFRRWFGGGDKTRQAETPYTPGPLYYREIERLAQEQEASKALPAAISPVMDGVEITQRSLTDDEALIILLLLA